MRPTVNQLAKYKASSPLDNDIKTKELERENGNQIRLSDPECMVEYMMKTDRSLGNQQEDLADPQLNMQNGKVSDEHVSIFFS